MSDNKSNGGGVTRPRKSRATHYSALALTLVIGIALALLVFQYEREIEYERVRAQVAEGIRGLSDPESQAFMAPLLESLFQRVEALAADVTRAETVDQALLDEYRWEMNYFEDAMYVNFEYIAPGEGGGYYLRHVSSGHERQVEPDENYLDIAMQRLAMEQATDSSEISVYSFTPLQVDSGRDSVSRYFLPIYSSDTVPSTVKERRDKLVGFVAATLVFDMEQLGAFTPQTIKGIEAAFYPAIDDPVRLGDRSARHRTLATLEYDLNGMPRQVTGWATPARISAELTNRPWWVMLAVLAITAAICTMIRRSAVRSDEVMRLVDERTRELEERTHALEEANRALKESEARYKMLADNATDVIYTHDLHGICTYISPSIYHQRGYTPEELVGTNLMEKLVPESAARAQAALDDARRLIRLSPERLGGSRVTELDAVCRDGSVITIENTTSFLFDDELNVIGVLGVSRDITERRRAEREKDELEDAWRHTQKMEAIGTLAGGVAHDFNNLLTGILGYTDMLKQQVEDDTKMAHSVAVIEKAASRAQELTSQLLGFARKGKYQSVPVNLNDSVQDVMSFLERTIDKSITLDKKLCDEQPMMVGDPSQINQLLLNLAVNAKDAMPTGGTLCFETRIIEIDEIFSRAHPGTEPGTYSLILVSDTGVGMSREKMDRIFEPFFTDKEQGKGTGMGLAMVYGVATSHGGTVSVYSEEGIGTTFRIYLPYASVSTQARAEAQPHPVHGSGCILVVDDEEILRDLADMMLGDLGYDVVTANDGIDAVGYYRDHWQDVDLVILDMIMPRMGGIDCLTELKKINPDIKAILSTGYSSVEYADRLSDENIVGFLQKPFRQQEVSELVADVLRAH